MTAKEFCDKHGITCKCTEIPERTDSSEAWKGATHWRVRIKTQGNRNPATGRTKLLTVQYSRGSAYTGEPPEVGDVLESLKMDASEFQGDTVPMFEEWARNYGYDTDSRKAERVYRACRSFTWRLRAFLGQERFDELMATEE